MRPTVAILSTENLINNIQVIKSIAKNSKILAMVKSNGYGHGIRSVAMRIEHLVDGFGVSSIDEGLILRKVGIKSNIVLAEGVFSPDEISIASENNFQIIINNIEQIEWLEHANYIARPSQLHIPKDYFVQEKSRCCSSYEDFSVVGSEALRNPHLELLTGPLEDTNPTTQGFTKVRPSVSTKVRPSVNYKCPTHIKNKLKIWIKIDTGLSRLGFIIDDDLREIEDIFNRIKKLYFIDDEIVLISHFGCADDINHSLTLKQTEKFKLVSSYIENMGFRILKSLCASVGIINFPEYHYDIVRPGLMLYGASPVLGKSAKDLGLKSVMQLETKILTTKIIRSGKTIGYGATYICKEDIKVGIIPIGYGDGYSRTFRTGTPVLVNSKICHIVGRIAMDMTVINLTNAEDAKSGDRVILWGQDLSIDEVAKYSNCVPYDLFTGVQHRVRFHWL